MWCPSLEDVVINRVITNSFQWKWYESEGNLRIVWKQFYYRIIGIIDFVHRIDRKANNDIPKGAITKSHTSSSGAHNISRMSDKTTNSQEIGQIVSRFGHPFAARSGSTATASASAYEAHTSDESDEWDVVTASARISTFSPLVSQQYRWTDLFIAFKLDHSIDSKFGWFNVQSMVGPLDSTSSPIFTCFSHWEPYLRLIYKCVH